MLTNTVENALNKQLNEELYSSYIYLAISSDLERKGLKGMANWMRKQVEEELQHVLKFYTYILERGGEVKYQQIAAPQVDTTSALSAFEQSYKHERHISGLINELVDISRKESDHATENFLQWFVNEQVEEETSVSEVVDSLKLAGNHGAALLMLDKELGQRQTSPASSEE